METIPEFHYRLSGRVGGHRPGSHPGVAIGAGLDYAGHNRLFDNPDPRRLDLRASLRDPRGDWLVRAYRQRAASTLYAVVDLSASMWFGPVRNKIQVAADLVASIGQSAFRVGDAAGMAGFGASDAKAISIRPRHGRGVGMFMADRLRAADPKRHRQEADQGLSLKRSLELLGNNRSIVFLVSDFHWPLDQLEPLIDRFSGHILVPVVIWDPAETTPPTANGLLNLQDLETGAYQPVWINQRVRERWIENVNKRREQIDALFAAYKVQTFHINGVFDTEALSRYFLESN